MCVFCVHTCVCVCELDWELAKEGKPKHRCLRALVTTLNQMNILIQGLETFAAGEELLMVC